MLSFSFWFHVTNGLINWNPLITLIKHHHITCCSDIRARTERLKVSQRFHIRQKKKQLTKNKALIFKKSWVKPRGRSHRRPHDFDPVSDGRLSAERFPPVAFQQSFCAEARNRRQWSPGLRSVVEKLLVSFSKSWATLRRRQRLFNPLIKCWSFPEGTIKDGTGSRLMFLTPQIKWKSQIFTTLLLLLRPVAPSLSRPSDVFSLSLRKLPDTVLGPAPGRWAPPDAPPRRDEVGVAPGVREGVTGATGALAALEHRRLLPLVLQHLQLVLLPVSVHLVDEGGKLRLKWRRFTLIWFNFLNFDWFRAEGTGHEAGERHG